MKKYLRLIAITPFVMLTLINLISCSRFEKLKSSEATSSATSSAGDNSNYDSNNDSTTGADGETRKISLPIFLMSADQMRTSMLTVTNRPPDVRIIREFGGRYAMFADGTDLNLANAPFQLSATSLAGAICQEAYDEETLLAPEKRTVFKVFDFSINATKVTDQQFNAYIRSLARLFWARNETAEELKHLQVFRTEFMSDPAVPKASQNTVWRNFSTGICAAILSSFDALTY